MLKTNYVSRQDYDTARTQLNEAEANVTVAKAAVEQATINLQYANVTSPITGVSGKSSVTVGALVTANQADSLVTVQRLDPIYVDLTQSVQDFLRMKEEVASGQIKQVQGSTPVQLNLENGKRYSQTGTLKFSDPTVDETTGSVTLRAIFPNPNGDLLHGMYVTALVDEGSRQNVLLVPQEGVTHNACGKATALILDKDDVVQLREIEASKAIGDQWVVTSGLQAGDRVIVSGLQRIRPGIKARAISSSPRKTPAPNRNNNVAGLRGLSWLTILLIARFLPRVLAIIMMLAGGLAIMNLPVAQYPQIAPPTITVSATYPVPMRKR